jgi:hypothetical protein
MTAKKQQAIQDLARGHEDVTDGPPEQGEDTRIMDWSRDGICIWRSIVEITAKRPQG